jgi:hypothetical protein
MSDVSCDASKAVRKRSDYPHIAWIYKLVAPLEPNLESRYPIGDRRASAGSAA